LDRYQSPRFQASSKGEAAFYRDAPGVRASRKKRKRHIVDHLRRIQVRTVIEGNLRRGVNFRIL